MNFDLSEDQRTIKATARELLASRSPFERVREAAEAQRYDDALWRELCALGWPGIAVGEEHGGQGLGAVELAVLLEELGYAVAATPLLGSALAALAIQHAGSDEQRARWLPALASGDAAGAFGRADLVADAQDADVIVVVEDARAAPTHGAEPRAGGDDRRGASPTARLIARADADVEPIDSIDPTRRYARVRGDGPALGGDVPAALDRAAAAVAGELVGVCQRALDMTVAYVKERKQFGVPVGAFQAVGHRCAQMLLHTEGARSTAYFAAWAADAAPDRLAEAAGLARATAGDAGREVTASAIQAHGGIGFTWEADVHWLYKRAQLDAALLGSATSARIALARLVAARY
ncbi:MAG TPA: acyl-CoA dehydrogenase family protein [Solirubrobacteraceae bacterium]|nr:acyl-CoA dehydrogenase family protein [Solirubrobacteraceae bacterium]